MGVLSMDARSAIVLEEVTRADMALEARGSAWLAANEVTHSYQGSSANEFRRLIRTAIWRRCTDRKRKDGGFTRGNKPRAVLSDQLDRIAVGRRVETDALPCSMSNMLRLMPPIVARVVMYQIKHGTLRGLYAQMLREVIESGRTKAPSFARLFVPSASKLERMLADVRRCAQGQMEWHELATHNRQPQPQRRRSVQP